MALSFDDLSELTVSEAVCEGEAGEPVTAIFRVREPGYVPSGVHVRARVDDELFTGTATPARLEELSSDDNVVSVEASAPLQIIR